MHHIISDLSHNVVTSNANDYNTVTCLHRNA